MKVNTAKQKAAIKEAIAHDTFTFVDQSKGIIASCNYSDILDDLFCELISFSNGIFTVRSLDNNQLLTIEA